jgi:hypothetical protein
MRSSENTEPVGRLLGAAGGVVSELFSVVSVTVRITDLLFAASIAWMPNLYAVPLYKRVAEYDDVTSIDAIKLSSASAVEAGPR